DGSLVPVRAQPLQDQRSGHQQQEADRRGQARAHGRHHHGAYAARVRAVLRRGVRLVGAFGAQGVAVGFEHAIRASKGARSYQEDAADVWEKSGALTAVLADGMGGHTGGALASGLACKFFLHAFATSSGEASARLAEALDLANAAIAHETAENP